MIYCILIIGSQESDVFFFHFSFSLHATNNRKIFKKSTRIWIVTWSQQNVFYLYRETSMYVIRVIKYVWHERPLCLKCVPYFSRNLSTTWNTDGTIKVPCVWKVFPSWESFQQQLTFGLLQDFKTIECESIIYLFIIVTCWTYVYMRRILCVGWIEFYLLYN